MTILNHLSDDTEVDVSSVLVEVNKGRVILMGTVPTQRLKNNILEQSNEISGVISTDNQIEVMNSENHGLLTDAGIEDKAKKLLACNPDIDASKITVNVDSRHITLKGTVNSYYRLHKAKKLVSNIKGVILVKNELAVVTTEKVTDEMIAKNIIEDFNRSHHLVASSILVEVYDGVVTLTGSVKNNEGAKEAFESVARTIGVRKIINNINIALR
jgi:osmotically-inducible protein OsmY